MEHCGAMVKLKKISEESVTKKIIKKLIEHGWTILSYDFPQSGTGYRFKQNDDALCEKCSVAIPDIVAIKDKIGLVFENKNRFYKEDFSKVNLYRNGVYSNSFSVFFNDYALNNIYYGVGMPAGESSKIHESELDFVDFVLVVDDESESFFYNPQDIII